MQIRSGGTCNWPLKGGARLIEVATAGGTVYGHCGHLGHLTKTFFYRFMSPFPRSLHISFGC